MCGEQVFKWKTARPICNAPWTHLLKMYAYVNKRDGVPSKATTHNKSSIFVIVLVGLFSNVGKQAEEVSNLMGHH